MSLIRKLNVGVILELVRLGVSLDRVCGQISAIKNFQSISKMFFDKRFKMTLFLENILECIDRAYMFVKKKCMVNIKSKKNLRSKQDN